MKVNAFPYLKEEHTEQQECKERPHTQTVLRKVYHVLEILSLERAVLESEQPVLRGLSCEDGLQHALVARLLVVQLEDEVLSVKPPSASPRRSQSQENHRCLSSRCPATRTLRARRNSPNSPSVSN